MDFAKWEALGNDYVIIDAESAGFEPSPKRISLLCDRHLGIGSDGVLLIGTPQSPGAVASLRIFNPDGSEAELSGNGARQALLFLHREGRAPASRFAIDTPAGEVRAEILAEDRARVDMGRASTRSAGYPEGDDEGRGSIAAGGELWSFRHVSIGNPQCVIRVDDTDVLEGLQISASGTGACGAAVDYVLRGAGPDVIVEMDGGELEVTVGEDLHIDLTGTASELFRGTVSPELRARLDLA